MILTWLFADDAEICHGVHDAQKRINRLGALPYHGLVDLQLHPIMVEVLLNLFAVEIENVQVHDREASCPTCVAVGQFRILDVEDSIEEREVVLNLLVAFSVKACRGLGDLCLETDMALFVSLAICFVSKRK
jgi:hypothetical protein